MLHGWTEYDAIRLEQALITTRLDGQGERPLRESIRTRVRVGLASILASFATRIAPTTIAGPRPVAPAQA